MIKTTCLLILSFTAALAQEKAPDPSTAGWVSIGKDDFVPVNGKPDTWRWGGRWRPSLFRNADRRDADEETVSEF